MAAVRQIAGHVRFRPWGVRSLGRRVGSPAHDPSAEQITDVEVDEDTATVRSVIQTAGNTTCYYEYQLLRGDDGWRISHLSTFLDPPGTPLIDPARVVAPFGEPAPLEVLHLGKLTCASGVLTVLDLGSVDAHFVPLARRITPETYAVEVATAAEMTVAVRLLLSEAPAVSWHPAEFTDGAHGVGVDAGNVAILAGEVVDAVMVSSGYGDGTYPCYWGLAADGSLTSLVVDFRVLAPDGALLLDGDHLGTFITGGISSRTWNPDAPPPPGSVLEVTEYLGYRHI